MGGRNGCDGHEPASGQVVYKVGFPVGAKRRVLSGSFGTAGWSNGYSQWTMT
jgi:hypothetical protein